MEHTAARCANDLLSILDKKMIQLSSGWIWTQTVYTMFLPAKAPPSKWFHSVNEIWVQTYHNYKIWACPHQMLVKNIRKIA